MVRLCKKRNIAYLDLRIWCETDDLGINVLFFSQNILSLLIRTTLTLVSKFKMWIHKEWTEIISESNKNHSYQELCCMLKQHYRQMKNIPLEIHLRIFLHITKETGQYSIGRKIMQSLYKCSCVLDTSPKLLSTCRKQ